MMFQFDWLSSVRHSFRRFSRSSDVRRSGRRLEIASRQIGLCAAEPLEDRCLLATITVTSLADNTMGDGLVTLREAIQAAETDTPVDGSTAGSGADTITFASSLTSGLPSGSNATIVLNILDPSLNNLDSKAGPTAFVITTKITIQKPTGNNGITLARDDLSVNKVGNLRLFYISTTGDLTLDTLTLSKGLAEQGGALYNGGGTVTVTDTVFTDNKAQGKLGTDGTDGTATSFRGNNGGAGGIAEGGALYNKNGSLTVVRSMFQKNTAVGGVGGLGGTGFTGSYTSSLDYNVNSPTYINGAIGGVGGQGGLGIGGVVYVAGGIVRFDQSIVTGNSATGGQGGKGGQGGLIKTPNANYPATYGGVGGAGETAYGGSVAIEGGQFVFEGVASQIVSSQVLAGSGGLGGFGGPTVGTVQQAAPGVSGKNLLGGSVYITGGKVTFTGGSVTGTVTNSPYQGGGFYIAGGSTSIMGTIIQDHRVTGNGAGIYLADGDLSVAKNSLIQNNVTVGGNGGGVYVAGYAKSSSVVSITESMILNNRAEPTAAGASAAGGGIYNGGRSVLVSLSTVEGNKATAKAGTTVGLSAGTAGGTASGGGIYNALGDLTVVQSTLDQNQSLGGAGSDGVTDSSKRAFPITYPGGPGGSARGAAIFVNGGTFTLKLSTLSSNIAQAGAGGVGSTGQPVNSSGQPFGNTVSHYGGRGGDALGGAVFVASAGSGDVVSATVAFNQAIQGVGGFSQFGNKGQAGDGSGGGLYASVGTITLKSSLVATNTSSVQGRDVFGNVTSNGYNLIGASDGATGFANNDLVGIDPQLDTALAPNGGPTRTHALLGAAAGNPKSPAIDSGTWTGPTTDTDQRGLGFSRVVGASADIGAFEFGDSTGTGQPAVSISDVMVTEGNSGTVNAVFVVSLSAASSSDVFVTYVTADGTASAPADYIAVVSTQLKFSPNVTSLTVSIPVIGDTSNEGIEQFRVVLSSPVGATIADGNGIATIVDDDNTVPTISINDILVSEGINGTVNAPLTVSLSTPSQQTVSVNYATVDGSAIAGDDYITNNGTLTFAPGQTSQTITIAIIGDALPETIENLYVNLSGAINATIGDDQGQVTITDGDSAPTSLSINNVTIFEGNDGTRNAVFIVRLSDASGQFVTVDFATATGVLPSGEDTNNNGTLDPGEDINGNAVLDNGSATADEDFITNSGMLTFAPGETSKTITVAIIGDALYEADEDFVVNLSGPTNATISDGQGQGAITNDDSSPKLSIDDVPVSEGTGGTVNAVFMIRLSAPSGLPVTVNFATANGTAIGPDDYTASSGTVMFAPGQTNQTIAVSVVGDSSYESSQTFFVNLNSATNASVVDKQGIGTILDDDSAPGLSISNVILTEKTGSTVAAVFIVSLSEPTTLPVKVNYATASDTALGSDYLSKRGTLLFSPGQVSKTLSITVLGDTRDELDEAFFMNLSVPINASLVDGQGQCTITDDDATPTLMIDNKTVTEGTGSTVKANFTVRLSAVSGLPVTVSYAMEDDTAIASADYTSLNNSLTFLPGQISKTISVPITGDALDEANERFFVNLSSPISATLTNNRALGTITDNDATPKLWIGNLTVTEGNSGTVDVVFTVKLSAASSFPVTVNYATADGSATVGSDYNSANGSLTFNPGEITKKITVSILGDLVHEQLSKTFSLSLSNALNALFADSQGVGTILDND